MLIETGKMFSNKIPNKTLTPYRIMTEYTMDAYVGAILLLGYVIF
jgi:hypothetical protein